MNSNPGRVRRVGGAEFPVYMTPLTLACHMNNYELVMLLIRKGLKLEKCK